MAEPRFQLADGTVEALSAVLTALGPDLDRLWAEFNAQPPQWRRSRRGAQVKSWLELVENLYAVVEDIDHAPVMSAQTQEAPPVTRVVTGGASEREG